MKVGTGGPFGTSSQPAMAVIVAAEAAAAGSSTAASSAVSSVASQAARGAARTPARCAARRRDGEKTSIPCMLLETERRRGSSARSGSSQ